MIPLILLPILFFMCSLKLIVPRLRLLLKNNATIEKKPPPPPPKKNTPKVLAAEAAARQQPAAGLGTVFATFDSDGDGFITTKELRDSLQRLGLSATPGDVRGMIERADANGDGLIDAEEFRELHDSLRCEEDGEEEESSLREAFRVFDGDGDGLITAEELRSVLAAMGLRRGAAADEDCRDMIGKVDMDGDGMVNFEEFRRMMAAEGGKLF
ncbi:putative calcium-binding protein CML22 [Iris pallida]|uniref:Calcium-binding protein CML22 n=1 Tax=Iris pallida TaxID=29817 RepID=A0AAX6IDF3_IRIPA|nr:putative calcium-binding protein CML22 [Iris pallida]